MQSIILKRVQWIAPLFACAISLVSFSVSAGSVSASNKIGQVIFTMGSIRATNDGEVRVLRKGSKIHEGDVIKSSRFSRSHIRMKDGALIALRPGTEFGFNQYRYDEEDDSNNSSVLSLIKGGFRTISGLIGKVFKQNYEVRTSVATIGIRGTHYGLTICQQGDCNTDNKKNIEDGLYGSVIDGEVSAKNDSGEFIFSNDEFFHVESLTSQPRGLIEPPGVVFAQYESEETLKKMSASNEKADPQLERRQSQQANVTGTLATTNELLVQHINANFETTKDIDPNSSTGGIVTFPSGPGEVMSVSYFVDNSSAAPPSTIGTIKTITSDATTDNQFLFDSDADSNGMLVPVAAVTTASNQHIFALANASVVEPETVLIQNTAIKVGWGRWSEQHTSAIDGVVEPHVGQLHYLVATNTTTPSQLTQLGGLGGSITYATIGGTKATDLMGNVATNHATVSMSVTFGTTSTVDTFDITTVIGVDTYQAGISASPVLLNSAVSSGLNLIGTGSCTSCSGQASLIFFGPQADGAGTVYTIQDTRTNNMINGATVLDNTNI